MFTDHKKILEALERLERSLWDIQTVLIRIEHRLEPKNVTSFTIQQEIINMALLPIAPGFAPQFTATPQPVGVVLNPAQPVPTWVSSDLVNAPITVSSTGLVATVNIPVTAVVGTAFTLTVNYTNADATTATGTISLTIVAAPPADATSFVITQTT